jgi:hypothetical protein
MASEFGENTMLSQFDQVYVQKKRISYLALSEVCLPFLILAKKNSSFLDTQSLDGSLFGPLVQFKH